MRLHGTDRSLCHLRVRLKYFWLYDYSILVSRLQVFFRIFSNFLCANFTFSHKKRTVGSLRPFGGDLLVSPYVSSVLFYKLHGLKMLIVSERHKSIGNDKH